MNIKLEIDDLGIVVETVVFTANTEKRRKEIRRRIFSYSDNGRTHSILKAIGYVTALIFNFHNIR